VGLNSVQVMPAPANTTAKRKQADFTLRAKVRLMELGLSVSDLAREFGCNRNTVSLAINRGLFEPTRARIAERLGISL